MTAIKKKTKKPVNDPTMKLTRCSFRFFMLRGGINFLIPFGLSFYMFQPNGGALDLRGGFCRVSVCAAVGRYITSKEKGTDLFFSSTSVDNLCSD